jgi:hypothetical protein
MNDEHIVLIRRPVDAGVTLHQHYNLAWSGQLDSAPARRYRCGCS